MSRVASNFITLDEDKDKDLIEKMDKEHQEELKNINYAIDLNTGKVKQNNHYIIYITDNENKDIIHIDKTLNRDLKDIYLINMEHFNKGLDIYKDLDNYKVIMYDKIDNKKIDKLTPKEKKQYILENYTSKLDNIDALNVSIIQFNKYYDEMYLNNFNLRVKDLLDDEIKKEYVKQLASAYTQVQVSDIVKIGQIEWLNSDLDTIKDFKFNLDKDTLKTIQKELLKIKDELSNDDTNKLEKLIYNANLDRFTKEIDTYIDADKEYYKKVHKLYQEIDKKIINIVDTLKVKKNKLSKVALIPKTPKNKEISLYASKIFNNTYSKDKNTLINLNGGYTLTMKIVIDEVNDLRDIVLYDEIQNQVVSLYPIDLALFIAFTNINIANGGNATITLEDALKVISENNIKIKKGNRQLDYYRDRLLLFDRTKVLAKVVKEVNNQEYVLYENYEDDPISILSTSRVWIENRAKTGYEIGQSAILSIIKALEKDSGINYLTTIQNANKYINDGQNNTIAILNMKYHILISVLQRKNQKDNDKIYNPIINLEDLYKQIAHLQDKQDLSRTEKQRVREQIDKYMHHLYKKDLIESYSYHNITSIGNHKTNDLLISEYKTSTNGLIKSDTPNKNNNKPITHLEIRPKK